MRIGNIKRICGLLFAVLLFSCLAACGRQEEQPEQPVQTPEPTETVEEAEPEQPEERPELVEPELQPSSLINGDFEQNFDEYGALPGWNVEFSEWGEGEAAASFSLSTEKDNTPNTTQKLSLYNGMAKKVEFTVSQTVENLAEGEYIVSCIFEGGPADTATRTKLTVNGAATEFGSYAGWKNWQQIKSRTFTVERGGTATIEISGTMKSKDWMDMDDIELTLSSEFKPRVFAKFSDEVSDEIIYDCLTNGDFETGEDANGLLPGWTVEFANWGSDEARAAYRLTTEYDNINTSQKLSLGNDTGADNPFTITQKFRSPEEGQYVIAVDWEGKPGQTDFYLSVNGERVPFGKAEGWKNWAQAASNPFTVKRGDVVTIEIGGTMGIGGWMDIDNVIFVVAADFVPKQFPKVVSGGSSYSAPAPLQFVTMDHIQNGDFSEGVNWTYAGNPDGYLPGWILPGIDWNTWRYGVTDEGVFTVTNISESASASTFELKQFVNLAPGCYTLNAQSGNTWDDYNRPKSITMSVKADGNVLASVQKTPGCGDLATNDFTLAKTTTVEVSFVFSLCGQAGLELDNVEFHKIPTQIENGDFTQGIDWDDPAYPNGKLPGWTLPKVIDWNIWRFNTNTPNVFEVNNISSETSPETFTMSQKIVLQPGTYTLDADSPWTWDANNPNGVTISVTPDTTARAAALAVLSMNPGCSKKSSEAFTVEQATVVDVAVTFSLVGNKTAAIKDVKFTPYVQKDPDTPVTSVQWTHAEQIGGTSDKTDTTGIALTFDKEITGLTADALTVTGATKGALTDNGNGSYTLAISGITVANGENVTVSVTGPSGYVIEPASKEVTVYKEGGETPGEPFADPIKNGKFATSSADTSWALPTDWNLSLGGSAITTKDELDVWCTAHSDSTFKLGTIAPDYNTGLQVWVADDSALNGFSLTQPIELEPGGYRLNYKLTGSSWGLTFGIAGEEKMEETSSGEASGSLEFMVSTKDTYMLTISKSSTWSNDYFELESVTLEKLSD